MKPINQFVVASEPIISLVTKLQGGDRGKELPENYRALIMSKLAQFKATLTQGKIPEEKITAGVYALAAFIDELVLLSEWPGKKQWISQTLQWQFFQEHVAGEGFFKQLTILRQQGESQADILQLYYICLQLGFQGKYRMQGNEQLNAYLVDFKAQLLSYYQLKTNALSPQNILAFSKQKLLLRKIPYWVITCTFLIALLGVYSCFKLADHFAASRAVNELNKIAQSLPDDTHGR